MQGTVYMVFNKLNKTKNTKQNNSQKYSFFKLPVYYFKWILLFIPLLIFSGTIETRANQFKPIDRDSTYIGRMYIYIDMNSCAAYLRNVSVVEMMTKKYNLERVVFMQQEEKEYAQYLKEENNWKSKVIADEYQIFREYYGFKEIPGFMILDSEGEVILNTRLDGANIKFKELTSLFDSLSKKSTKALPLKVLSKANVLTNGKTIRAGYHKFGTFDDKNEITYIRFNGSNSILKIDSTGQAEILTSKNTHPLLKEKRPAYHNIFIDRKRESIIALQKGKYYSRKNKLFIYNIEKDKYSLSFLDKTEIVDTTFISNAYSYLNDKLFISYDTWYNTKSGGFVDWNSFHVFDLNGEFITSFGKPSIFFTENYLDENIMI